MDLRKVFATNLRRWRNARGLSQDDLAYEAGDSRSYLSQLEKGVYYAVVREEPMRSVRPVGHDLVWQKYS